MAPSNFRDTDSEAAWPTNASSEAAESALFDFELYDWRIAEDALDAMAAEGGPRLSIQRPPLAYTDHLARVGALEAGKCWYFSIADFELALVDGALKLKQTDGEAALTVDVTGTTPLDLSKPMLFKKASPTSIIEMGRGLF